MESAWESRYYSQRPSICFSVDAVVSSHDIIVGLDNASIDVDDITSIQRRASNNSWVVTFASRAVKDAALNEHQITIAGCSVLVGDCENRVSIVKVYELPGEIPDSVVIGRLAHYGRVISFRRDRVADAIFNGVRTARMLIERPIPAQTFIAGEFVRFWYPNQPKTCRKCGSDDHLAANCKSQRCFNCERPGHRAEQCDMPALCRVCLADGHETTNCPYIYYSSNVTSPKPADKSTSEPTDKSASKPASKPALSYSGAARAGKVAAAAREVEDTISQTKRDEDKRARREEKDRERKEKDRREKERKEERERRKEKERKEKERRERREREREERDSEDQRERDYRKDKHHDRHKDSEDHGRGRDAYERDRDRHRYSRDPSRDRSSHRRHEHSDSEDGSWTRVSYRKSKSY